MPRALNARVAFGKPLAEQGVMLARIAESRIAIEQARLLMLKAADMMDTLGNKAARARDRDDQGRRARTWLCRVIDRAIQAHGGAGVTEISASPRPMRTHARCASPMARTRCTAIRSQSLSCASTETREPNA